MIKPKNPERILLPNGYYIEGSALRFVDEDGPVIIAHFTKGPMAKLNRQKREAFASAMQPAQPSEEQRSADFHAGYEAGQEHLMEKLNAMQPSADAVECARKVIGHYVPKMFHTHFDEEIVSQFIQQYSDAYAEKVLSVERSLYSREHLKSVEARNAELKQHNADLVTAGNTLLFACLNFEMEGTITAHNKAMQAAKDWNILASQGGNVGTT